MWLHSLGIDLLRLRPGPPSSAPRSASAARWRSPQHRLRRPSGPASAAAAGPAGCSPPAVDQRAGRSGAASRRRHRHAPGGGQPGTQAGSRHRLVGAPFFLWQVSSDAGNLMTTLRWRDITLRKKGNLILDRVSLSAAPGALLGIVGPERSRKNRPPALRHRIGGKGPKDGRWTSAASPRPIFRRRPEPGRWPYLPQQAEAAWPITVAAASPSAACRMTAGIPVKTAKRLPAHLGAVGMAGFRTGC